MSGGGERDEKLAATLRSMRRAAGLSLKDVAHAMGYVNGGHLSQLEAGVFEPRIRTLRSFAAACGYEMIIDFREKKP